MKNLKLVILAGALFAALVGSTFVNPKVVAFDAAAQRSNFISRYNANAVKMIEALEAAQAMKTEFDTRDYTTSIVDGDFVGSNDHLTAAQFKDAVGNVETYRALFFSNFYSTNVMRLRR
jgi:hypothetical protein